MRKLLTLRFAALAAMLLLCCSSIVTSSAYAQSCPCPECGTPPSGCAAWAGNGQIPLTNVAGSGCDVDVHYCYACCSGTNYIYISDFKVLNSNCSTVNPQDILNAAMTKLIYNTSVVGCNDPCPNGSTSLNVTTPTCWKKNGISAAWTYSGCASTGCFCVTLATVTCTNGVVTVTNCSTTCSGCPCSCTPNPGGGNNWNTGTCYQLDCPPSPC